MADAAPPTTATTPQLTARLQGYLRRSLDRPALELDEIAPIAEGHSGFTYWANAQDGAWSERYVLRLPPPGARIAGPADVLRQGRIMGALHEQGLPTPRIVANCDDAGVLDGRPFCLMQAVDGQRIEPVLAAGVDPLKVAAAAVETLKSLREVPVERSGLGGENPVSLTEEMMRWAWLMSRAPEELTRVAPALGARLAEVKPAEPGATLVHGDYHYGNMLFRVDDGEPRVVAVLDWEIAEVGAPLLDLGCLCIVSRSHQQEGAPNPGGGLKVDIEDVIRLYGSDPEESRWYLALSCYKYASIFGYNLMLHRRGKRPDAMYEGMTGVIESLIDNGLELLG